MGYDCYVRDTAKLGLPLWEEWTAIDFEAGGYFRRNIWGMPRVVEAVVEMGMGFDSFPYLAHRPSWPSCEQYGVHYDAEGEPAGPRAEEYKAALNAVLDWHGPEIPGIPIHKLCESNDGWHVTAAECLSALQLYRRALEAGKPHPEAFGDDFIPFLIAATKCDGFEVH